MSYSQNQEEKYITEYFDNQKGRLLDLGSFDGITFSNSFELIKQGWNAVLLEASPVCFASLMKNMKVFKQHSRFASDQLILINAAISNNESWQTFYDSNGDAVSGTDFANKEKWKAQVNFDEFLVHSIHWKKLKEQFGDVFNFINIDIEGISAQLFIEMFPEFPNCSLWCVEHDERKEELILLASTKGFKNIYENAENLILAR